MPTEKNNIYQLSKSGREFKFKHINQTVIFFHYDTNHCAKMVTIYIRATTRLLLIYNPTMVVDNDKSHHSQHCSTGIFRKTGAIYFEFEILTLPARPHRLKQTMSRWPSSEILMSHWFFWRGCRSFLGLVLYYSSAETGTWYYIIHLQGKKALQVPKNIKKLWFGSTSLKCIMFWDSYIYVFLPPFYSKIKVDRREVAPDLVLFNCSVFSGSTWFPKDLASSLQRCFIISILDISVNTHKLAHTSTRHYPSWAQHIEDLKNKPEKKLVSIQIKLLP